MHDDLWPLIQRGAQECKPIKQFCDDSLSCEALRIRYGNWSTAAVVVESISSQRLDAVVRGLCTAVLKATHYAWTHKWTHKYKPVAIASVARFSENNAKTALGHARELALKDARELALDCSIYIFDRSRGKLIDLPDQTADLPFEDALKELNPSSKAWDTLMRGTSRRIIAQLINERPRDLDEPANVNRLAENLGCSRASVYNFRDAGAGTDFIYRTAKGHMISHSGLTKLGEYCRKRWLDNPQAPRLRYARLTDDHFGEQTTARWRLQSAFNNQIYGSTLLEDWASRDPLDELPKPPEPLESLPCYALIRGQTPAGVVLSKTRDSNADAVAVELPKAWVPETDDSEQSRVSWRLAFLLTGGAAVWPVKVRDFRGTADEYAHYRTDVRRWMVNNLLSKYHPQGSNRGSER